MLPGSQQDSLPKPVHIKKSKNPSIFVIFSAFFPYMWPLAGPNIARKGWPLQKMARDDRQTHFGTFNFWIKPGFWTRVRALRAKTRISSNIWPLAQPNIAREGCGMLKTYWARRLCWPPAGKLQNSGIQKVEILIFWIFGLNLTCLLYTSPSPRDATLSRMPSSA